MRKLRPETLLRRFKTFCVLCTRRIPRKRQRRRCNTCSPEHQKLLTKMRKIERDARLCSHCGRPATAGEKLLFRQFRTSLSKDVSPRNPIPAKVIRGSAEGNKTLHEIAYVVVEGAKRRGVKKARKGAAA